MVEPSLGIKENTEDEKHFLHIYPDPAGRLTIIKYKYKVPVSG